MNLSLDYPKILAWIRQQDYNAAYTLSNGLTLSYQSTDGRITMELSINCALTSPSWLDDVLEKRYSNFEHYHACLPIQKRQDDWVLRLTFSPPCLTDQDTYVEEGLITLLSLAGIQVSNPDFSY